MRVITGIARGKKLKILEGLETRPTADRVKEAMFSIIHFDIEGAAVLDLFSGSGQLGIEAISRGAKHSTFVDGSKIACEVVRENLSLTGFTASSRVANMDSLDFLKGTKSSFDIAFLDPPYETEMLSLALPLVDKIMNSNGIVACEHENKLVLDDEIGRLRKRKTYKYGKVSLTVFDVKGE